MASGAKDTAARNELAALLAGADEDARCKALAADWLIDAGHAERLAGLETMDAAEEVLRLADYLVTLPTGELWSASAFLYYAAEDVVWILRRRQTGEWFADGIDLSTGEVR
jgi:hypothetical protein